MQDSFGRTIRYLRLSITNDCGMRCMYCRPAIPPAEDPLPLADHPLPLMPAEIEALVRYLVHSHGLKKVRLTGGEPTQRPDLLEIVQRLSRLGLDDLAMTTDGLKLAALAEPLAKAGLKRVNVSLDTLVPEKYQRITGVDGLKRALEGIDAALAAGLRPVKINTVVLRGENDHELSDLVLFAAWKKVEIRFIELMPMGPLAGRWEKYYVPEEEMRRHLNDVVNSWVARPGRGAARKYCAGMTFGRSVQVGFVSAMSCPFCDGCDRIRVTADGSYYPCLMDQPAGKLLSALRPKFDADALDGILGAGLKQKAREHPSVGPAVMTEVGG